MCRTTAARPIFRASSSTWGRSVAGTATRSGATEARKAWRRWSARAPASWAMSWPASDAWATQTRARPGSRSARASARAGQHDQFVVDGAAGRHLIQSGQGVACRPPAPSHGGVDRFVAQIEPGVVADLPEEIDQDVGPEKPELEVLCPAADGGQDLLGLGRRQHEDDMTGRLLQGLEQGVGGGRREHVDLVDDVDLPPARRPESGVGDQFAHGVDAVVRRGVQLVDVERRPPGDLDAGIADPTGFTPVGRRAVEGLGQNACRRRLARTPGSAEEVGVAHPVVAHGVAQGQTDVFLTEHLREPLRAEPPVERLVRSRCRVAFGGHRRSLPAGDRPKAGPIGVRCDGQVCYGTRTAPLRAAAFRP